MAIFCERQKESHLAGQKRAHAWECHVSPYPERERGHSHQAKPTLVYFDKLMAASFRSSTP